MTNSTGVRIPVFGVLANTSRIRVPVGVPVNPEPLLDLCHVVGTHNLLVTVPVLV